MDLFRLIGRYFWLIALAAGAQNLRSSSALQERLTTDLTFAADHRKLRRWLFGWTSLPWLVMGAGILSGHVRSVWYYFRPQDENPHVLAFWGCIFGLQVLFALWVYLGDGAVRITEHKLFAVNFFGGQMDLREPRTKLLVVGGGVLVSIAAFAAMILSDVPMPTWQH